MIKKHASFGYMNGQMGRLHKAILAEKLKSVGITYGQIGFIMQSLRNPGRSQDELSMILSVDKAATARAVANLVKMGLLYREENPENRRQKLVYPTEKAKAIKEDLHKELMAANTIMTSGLSEEEIEKLMELMGKVIDTSRDHLGMPRVWDYL
ncbi:MarR family winged helix-turn-helix transcriptional regulator [Maridesulfovibrio salexigens]|uniref:Transcriptional regulator, MarR family n=1 Tax=Maridesulfovibrio salexigens (strain ATCC 14822 / DSM 2638 / NCIMB 8403 / VKM B-1763) TaxID=526222 RepID=C6BU57_MARSD|nr:MarR family transcriptional regulator [Maridesulfovibrio salexigens]ACS81766.1 transcriptional regulator, MarR family [Maridesulfovibrio salexigens DSM 2638]